MKGDAIEQEALEGQGVEAASKNWVARKDAIIRVFFLGFLDIAYDPVPTEKRRTFMRLFSVWYGPK